MSKKGSTDLSIRRTGLFIIFLFSQNIYLFGQDNQAQLPGFLANTYINLNIGSINYHFTNAQMEPGFHAATIQIPHPAVRLAVALHRFNNNLSLQLSYMRPVNWIQYKNVNSDLKHHSIWTNYLGLSVKYAVPLSRKFSIYGEGGILNVTRNGFRIDDSIAIKSAQYTSILTGAGLLYHINPHWDLAVSSMWSPANRSVKNPQTLLASGGIIYYTHRISAEKLELNARLGYVFPKNIIQVGYTNSVTGYSVNKFVAEGKVPVFWSGDVHVRHGVMLHYQHNVFHSRKVFALYWGTSFSLWQSRLNRETFFTFSAYPLFRFTAIRSKPADIYFLYSVAGPSFISKTRIDNNETGKHFTFQDFMGIGFFAGRKRNMNAEFKIGHYSNGNLFPRNPGIDFPPGVSVGYSF
jgi:hypothetical protein